MWRWGCLILLLLLCLYSLIPNLLTRGFRLWAIRQGPTRRELALTFDDGPDPKYTDRLLDALRDAEIRATFFVIGRKALAHPDLVLRMLADGHQVEVHGWTHSFVPLLPPAAAVRQFRKTTAALVQRFGLRPRFYRPTWGALNLVTLLTAPRTHRLVTWSIMVGDWRVQRPGQVLERIVNRLHPGAIIVLHDSDETLGAETGAPEQVIALIPELGRRAREAGYSFRTLNEWYGKEGR
ncbi:MAG: polysaccharide deacetylase family protein [Alicyclobacillus herbarius]|uniref:polysaccharide deacetylase family protein n=1 Tax=Alicyclobacillus herbarius TaxID=122960 RepID=UPI0023570602|nr:polysaccharide deacetylase family protein [Alicyclobacillus herbarius]MCL6633358.1 polysaccharide deacetylase family protein [Alicyclobacillus herbarius]